MSIVHGQIAIVALYFFASASGLLAWYAKKHEGRASAIWFSLAFHVCASCAFASVFLCLLVMDALLCGGTSL